MAPPVLQDPPCYHGDGSALKAFEQRWSPLSSKDACGLFLPRHAGIGRLRGVSGDFSGKKSSSRLFVVLIRVIEGWSSVSILLRAVWLLWRRPHQGRPLKRLFGFFNPPLLPSPPSPSPSRPPSPFSSVVLGCSNKVEFLWTCLPELLSWPLC